MRDGLPARPPEQEPAAPAGPVRRSGIAIAALALGVLSIPLAFTIYVGLLIGLLAVALGVAGLVATRGGRRSGRGMATAGLVTGLLGLVFATALGLYGLHTYRDCQDRIGHAPTRDELRECTRTN
jgi:uncharacterized membrane protein HdeD (DUF308 family)